MAQKSIAIADERGHFLHVFDAELPIYSLAKPFIASTIFASGIDVDTPISNWIGAQLVPRAAEISVGHLLNHTSGIRDYGDLTDYWSAIRVGESPWSDDEFANRTLRKPLLFKPGTGWAYSNPGYWLLTRIVREHTGLSFDEAFQIFISDPLSLSATRVAHGQFADDLPWYPAEWVWHGVMISTASDLVRFMMSPLVEPLLGGLTRVPVQHPGWSDPHFGYGLMIEPGVRHGHNGSGPNYSASCFHFQKSGLTGCVLLQSDREEGAMEVLTKEISNRSGTTA